MRGEQDSGDFEYSPTYDGGWGAPYGNANQNGPSSSSNLRKFEDSSGGPGGDFSDVRVKSNLGSASNVGGFDDRILDNDGDRELDSPHCLKERSDSMDLDFEDDLDGEVLGSTGVAGVAVAGTKGVVNRDTSIHLNNRGFDADDSALLPLATKPTIVKNTCGNSTNEILSSVVSTRDEVVRAFSTHDTSSSTENILSSISPSKPKIKSIDGNDKNKNENENENEFEEDGIESPRVVSSNPAIIPFISRTKSYPVNKDILDLTKNARKNSYVIEPDHPLSAQNSRYVKPPHDQNQSPAFALSDVNSSHSASSLSMPSPHSPELSLKPPESQSMIMILAVKLFFSSSLLLFLSSSLLIFFFFLLFFFFFYFFFFFCFFFFFFFCFCFCLYFFLLLFLPSLILFYSYSYSYSSSYFYLYSYSYSYSYSTSHSYSLTRTLIFITLFILV